MSDDKNKRIAKRFLDDDRPCDVAKEERVHKLPENYKVVKVDEFSIEEKQKHFWDGFTRNHLPDPQCCDCKIRWKYPICFTETFTRNFVKCSKLQLREGQNREKHWALAHNIPDVEKDLIENAELFSKKEIKEARATIERLKKEALEIANEAFVSVVPDGVIAGCKVTLEGPYKSHGQLVFVPCLKSSKAEFSMANLPLVIVTHFNDAEIVQGPSNVRTSYLQDVKKSNLL